MNVVVDPVDGDHSLLLWVQGVPMVLDVYITRSATWSDMTVAMVDVSFKDAYGVYSSIETRELLYSKNSESYWAMLKFNNPVAAMREIIVNTKLLCEEFQRSNKGITILFAYEATSCKRSNIYARVMASMPMTKVNVYSDAYSTQDCEIWVEDTKCIAVKEAMNGDGITRIV